MQEGRGGMYAIDDLRYGISWNISIFLIPQIHTHKLFKIHAHFIHHCGVLLCTPHTFIPRRAIPLDATELPG